LDSEQSTLLKKAPQKKRTPSSRVKIGCLETTFQVTGMPNASSRVLTKVGLVLFANTLIKATSVGMKIVDTLVLVGLLSLILSG
jgi:hypothetical protein